MVDVLGVEILERGDQKLLVSRGVRNLDVNPSSGIQQPPETLHGIAEIAHVFHHMAQDDSVEGSDFGRKAGKRAGPNPPRSGLAGFLHARGRRVDPADI